MACAGACVAGAAGSLVLPAAVKTATAVGTAAAALVGLRSLKRKKSKRNKTKRNKKQKGGRQRLLTKRSKK